MPVKRAIVTKGADGRTGSLRASWCLPILAVFGVGLVLEALRRNRSLFGGGNIATEVSKIVPCEQPQKAESPAHTCNENPYRASLLEGHSFEIAEQRAQAWLANRTNVRDALYWKSHGKHSHDKFDAFQVMAPCHYSCTGECRADTSKIVCGAESLQTGCVIYSIGGNNQWEFEERIYDMTPCEIHTFDCTGPIARFHPPPRIQDRLTFHHVCLATENVPPVAKVPPGTPDYGIVGAMETLETMQKRLGHLRLDLLKLDIEGYEWPLFESWPELTDWKASSQVALPMQLLVEIHYRTQMHDLWPQSGDDFKNEIDLVNLQAHLLKMGYAVAVRDDNMMCNHCTELTLLRYKCLA